MASSSVSIDILALLVATNSVQRLCQCLWLSVSLRLTPTSGHTGGSRGHVGVSKPKLRQGDTLWDGCDLQFGCRRWKRSKVVTASGRHPPVLGASSLRHKCDTSGRGYKRRGRFRRVGVVQPQASAALYFSSHTKAHTTHTHTQTAGEKK